MKISYNWLKEILPINYTPREASEMLTACGLEVEALDEFESVAGGLKGLVVGEVKTCIRHPDADKLSLTTVDVGQAELFQIVCGAPNVAAGQKVIVALPGTKIFPLSGEPFVIKQAKIRGQISNGMICAEDEIGLGHSHEGVIVLPADAKTGTLASDYYQFKSDFIFEIGLTPNRADAASHVGVARDLASVFRTKKLIEDNKDEKISLHIPVAKISEPSGRNFLIDVSIEDKDACIRYSGITISDVIVAESPAWLKDRLRSIGVNPINNIVDITNYVLHECGQPLHAFDADQIKGKKVIVRSANEGEKFVTLDRIERTMRSGDLMICNESEAMCIAGVYGGLTSGITEKSKNVFIESACFNPASIRRTSKRHGLKTDASFRFERGTDSEITVYALMRAAALMCEIAGGKISSAIIDDYPVKLNPAVIEIKFDYLDKFCGEKIDRTVISTIIDSLGMKIISTGDDNIKIEVPLFKVDVTRPADVAEEIMRIYGYDRIPVPEKINASLPKLSSFDKEKQLDKIAAYLSANGFNEIVNNSLTKGDYVTLPGWKAEYVVTILNPLSQELSVMRQDLLAGALETLQYNSNRKQSDIKTFEFGKTYFKEDGYSEEFHLSLLLSGNRAEASWKIKDADSDFYQLKSFVGNLLSLCGIENVLMTDDSSRSFSSSLKIKKGEDLIGEFGEISKTVLKKFDITRKVFYADFNWDKILKHSRKSSIHYSEVSKFPAVRRDLSILITSEISYAKLEDIAYNAEKKLLKEVRLFDVYDGDKIEHGKKSYALSFILQDDQQTLTEAQIGKVMNRLMTAFEEKAGAVIRKQ